LKLAPCGIECDRCNLRPEKCDGCHADTDHQWHADCGIRVCCRFQKRLDNCAQCDGFPCERIKAFGSDKYEHHRAAVERLHELRGSSQPFDQRMIGIGGAYCGSCRWCAKTGCKGCQAAKGAMFWGVCAVAKCALTKGLEHCGLCAELPCAKLRQCFDHPEHGDRGERLANLQSWARGQQRYLDLRPPGLK